jgi:hypothetical protein
MVHALVKSGLIQQVLEKNATVIDFFETSSHWGMHLNKIQTLRNIPQGLIPYLTSRPESLSVSTALMELNKSCFNELLSHPDAAHSQYGIPQEIQTILSDTKHFSENAAISILTKPIAETVLKLESEGITLGEAYLELLLLGQHMNASFNHIHDHFDLKFQLMNVYNRYMHSLDTELCILGLFLDPGARQLAVTRKFNVGALITRALHIVHSWDWKLDAARALKLQLLAYASSENEFDGEVRIIYSYLLGAGGLGQS